MQDPSISSQDFDFQIGQWTVRHRRLRDRLSGCTEWDEFQGTADVRPVLGGNGNIEDNVLHFPSETIRAIAVRSFDPSTQSWAIWWLASDEPHRMQVPVVGRFESGIGRFVAEDCLRGEAIVTRFLWLQTDTNSPRWEQAMSADGGTTWETNWTMDFARK